MKPLLGVFGLAIAVVVIGCAGTTIVSGGLGGTTLDQARARLKALTEAFPIYLADNDDGAPTANHWMDGLAAYTDDANFHAPGMTGAAYGFAFNEAVAGKHLSDFPDRSIIPLFFDSTNTARNATAAIDTMPVPGRYDGTNVISYLDGFQEGFDIVAESRKRLKSLGVGLLIYAGDSDDRYPGTGWADALTPYVGASRGFRSPIFDSVSGKYGYALNSAVAGQQSSAIDDPAHTILVFDSTNLAWNAVAPTSTLPQPGRYSGYNTAAYGDGSTRFFF